jgi:hypothetical protein
MSPVNWYSLLQIDAWLFPTTSMVVVGEKLGTNPRIDQPSCYRLGQKPFFLRAMDLFNSIDDLWKVATYGDCPHEAYECRTWVVVWSVRVVCIRFPCRMFTDSNHRDFQIWVTAWLVVVSTQLINVILFNNKLWLYFTLITYIAISSLA